MSKQKKDTMPASTEMTTASNEGTRLQGEQVDTLKETSALSTPVDVQGQTVPKDKHEQSDVQADTLLISDGAAQLGNTQDVPQATTAPQELLANKAAKQGLTVLLLDLGMEMDATQRQVYLLAKGLHGHDDRHVLVACPKHSALHVLLKNEGIPCWALPSNQVMSVRLWLSLLFLIYKRNIRIVHTQDALSCKIGTMLKRWFKDRFSLVHAQRVSCTLGASVPMKQYMLFDGFICPCQHIAEELRVAGMPKEKVYTVYSGTDPSAYPAKQENHDGRFIFMAIGSLAPQKYYSLLFQSMLFLSEMDDMPLWEVRIVGNGALHQDLVAEVENIGVSSAVAMLGRQDHRKFLPDADVILSLSNEVELASATIREAWASGLPVICTNNAANLELVQDKQNGFVVQEGNAGVLAGVMMRIMKEPQGAIKYVEAGKRSLEQKYLASQMVENTLIVYKKIDADLRAKSKK